jgi:nucleotide-binding universal stress UspA family protein
MYQKVLAHVDRNDSYARGVREAIWMANANNAQLRFVHVYNGAARGGCSEHRQVPSQWLRNTRFCGRELLHRSVRLAKIRGVGSEQVLVECVAEETARAIVEHAQQWGADMIVMGSRGPNGSLREALGDDALEVLRISPVPVLLVPGFAADGAPDSTGAPAHGVRLS